MEEAWKELTPLSQCTAPMGDVWGSTVLPAMGPGHAITAGPTSCSHRVHYGAHPCQCISPLQPPPRMAMVTTQCQQVLGDEQRSPCCREH